MKKLVSSLLATLICVGVATTVQAQEKKGKGKDAPKGEKAEGKKRDTYPFNGKVASADKSAMTITLQGKEKSRVIKVTSQTKIEKDGKPATFDDAKAGEAVRGSLKKDASGAEVATLVRIGQAPEGKAKGKEGDKKKEKK